jgi:hypothetical protein
MVLASFIGSSVCHDEAPILHLRAGDQGRSIEEEIGDTDKSGEIPIVLITAWLLKLNL